MENEEIEVNTYLIDNTKYIEIDNLEYNNNEYLLLYEENKIDNIMILKKDKNELVFLNDKEFYEVINKFKEKNMNLY